jgi:hypothetical protein
MWRVEPVTGLPLVALVGLFSAACGGHPRRLGERSWYGKVVTVNVRNER